MHCDDNSYRNRHLFNQHHSNRLDEQEANAGNRRLGHWSLRDDDTLRQRRALLIALPTKDMLANRLVLRACPDPLGRRGLRIEVIQATIARIPSAYRVLDGFYRVLVRC
jgi:hypothetical protein